MDVRTIIYHIKKVFNDAELEKNSVIRIFRITVDDIMDDERLKSGTYLADKYFDEQLERIREIRVIELKFYQKMNKVRFMEKVKFRKTALA